MKKLWSKQNGAAKLRVAAKKNSQLAKFRNLRLYIYIYIRIYIFFGLNCTVPALSSSCKASVCAVTMGLRNLYI